MGKQKNSVISCHSERSEEYSLGVISRFVSFISFRMTFYIIFSLFLTSFIIHYSLFIFSNAYAQTQGQRCEYTEPRSDGTYRCDGSYQPHSSGNLTCQFDSAISSNCTKLTAIDQIFGRINPPDPIKNIGFGAGGIGRFLTNIIGIIYAFAGIIFLFMLIIGAFQWITSGGDKEGINKARGRIINAIVGLVLLALAYVLARFIGTITGFTII